jgi:phosphatidate phosphatase APP1
VKGAEDVHKNETLQFFPSMGYLNPTNNNWEIEVHGWVYEWESRQLLMWSLQKALGLDEMDAASQRIFKDRARAFLYDNQGQRLIRIKLDDTVCSMGKSSANGHFYGRFALTESLLAMAGVSNINAMSSHALEIQAVLPAGDQRQFTGTLNIIPPTGWSVISDVDDTIKISVVTNRHELLQNTFCRPFKPVPGMASVYQLWATNQGVQFHYVSGSPWQMAQPILDFLHAEGYPIGTFHLRPFRWVDGTALNFFESPYRHKMTEIGQLLERFPQRRFILVGDNGEQDPEIYGEMARKHPQQIEAIYVRNIMRETVDGARYQKAFAGIPREHWHLFAEPSEIQMPL